MFDKFLSIIIIINFADFLAQNKVFVYCLLGFLKTRIDLFFNFLHFCKTSIYNFIFLLKNKFFSKATKKHFLENIEIMFYEN